MEIFQHLTTKLQVELAVKLVNALQNMVALQIQILFRTKSFYPFSYFIFDIILLVFLFFSYASWWRNGGTNQEVKWGKF